MMLKMMIAAPLLQAAYYSWTSKINQFFFFGRSVPPEFASTPEGKSIQKQYRLKIWLGCPLAMSIGLLLYQHGISTGWLWALLFEGLVFYFAFAQANQAAMRLAPQAPQSSTVEAQLTPAGHQPPSMMALLAPLMTGVAILLFGLVRAASGVSLTAAPQALDNLVAAHGGESMFSFGMGLAFAGLAALLIRKTARSRTPLGHHALWSSIVATWAGVAIMTFPMCAAFAGFTIPHAESRAIMYGVLLLALGVVLFRTVANRRYTPPSAEMYNDDNWRWGMFYVNRNDPALFVQCRCGAGFTLNYGRATAWPIVVMFTGLMVTLLIALARH